MVYLYLFPFFFFCFIFLRRVVCHHHRGNNANSQWNSAFVLYICQCMLRICSVCVFAFESNSKNPLKHLIPKYFRLLDFHEMYSTVYLCACACVSFASFIFIWWIPGNFPPSKSILVAQSTETFQRARVHFI